MCCTVPGLHNQHRPSLVTINTNGEVLLIHWHTDQDGMCLGGQEGHMGGVERTSRELIGDKENPKGGLGSTWSLF